MCSTHFGNWVDGSISPPPPFRNCGSHGEAGWHPEGGAQVGGGGCEGQSCKRLAAVQGHSLNQMGRHTLLFLMAW